MRRVTYTYYFIVIAGLALCAAAQIRLSGCYWGGAETFAFKQYFPRSEGVQIAPLTMKISSAFIAASAIVSTVSGFSTVSPLRRSKCAAATRPLHMSVEEMEMVTLDCEERMDKTMSNLAENLLTIRTGRANANMLDRVEADYYGAMTPINQMATISVPSSQQLQISPFDKSSLVDIEKAIIYSGLGFTPNNDGNVLRINIPQLTEDRRKELLKQCKSIGEEAKVAIRNIRRDGVDSIKKMEKAGDLGEDQALDGIDEIQKATDKHVKQVDESVSKKEKEVTTL